LSAGVTWLASERRLRAAEDAPVRHLDRMRPPPTSSSAIPPKASGALLPGAGPPPVPAAPAGVPLLVSLSDALCEAEALSLADADSDAEADADADADSDADALALALAESIGNWRPVTAAVAEPGSSSDAASRAAPAAATRPAATASPVFRSPLARDTFSFSGRATTSPPISLSLRISRTLDYQP
jgi:hypothetical protein